MGNEKEMEAKMRAAWKAARTLEMRGEHAEANREKAKAQALQQKLDQMYQW